MKMSDKKRIQKSLSYVQGVRQKGEVVSKLIEIGLLYFNSILWQGSTSSTSNIANPFLNTL